MVALLGRAPLALEARQVRGGTDPQTCAEGRDGEIIGHHHDRVPRLTGKRRQEEVPRVRPAAAVRFGDFRPGRIFDPQRGEQLRLFRCVHTFHQLGLALGLGFLK
jgi:hypothetical protein